MAAPVLASSTTFADTGNSTSRTINKPSGTSSGDWLFLAVSIDLSGTITTPTGFTQVFNDQEASGSMRLALYKRKADGTEGSTFTIATSSEIACGIMARVTGADSTEALDVFGIWQNELNATRSPGVLPTLEAYAACSDGSLVLQVAAFDNGGLGTFSATPSGYSAVSSGVGASSSGTHMAMYSKEYASAGYIGTGSWTFSANTEQGIGLTIVIRASANTSFPAQPVIRCMNAFRFSTATACTMPAPYGVVDNDLLVLIQTSRTASGTGLTPPAGFNSIQTATDGLSYSHQAHYKLASSEGSSYSVASSSQNSLLTTLMRIVNNATSSPIDTSSNNTGTSTTPTATTITPSVDNCLILYTSGHDDDEVAVGGGTPTGYTNVWADSCDDGTDCSTILARKEQTTAAATGSVQGSLVASEGWGAFAIAIKPPANTRTTSVAVTQEEHSLSASTKVKVSTSVNATQEEHTLSASTKVKVATSVNTTEEDDSLSATALRKNTLSGTATEEDDTLSASTKVAVRSSVAATEEEDSLSAAAAVKVSGSGVITEEEDTLSASTKVQVATSVTVTEQEDTLSSAVRVQIAATVNATEEDDSLSSAASVQGSGSVSVNATEQDDTSAASAAVRVNLSGTAPEGDDTLSTAVAVRVASSTAVQEEEDTLAATLRVRVTTSVSVTEEEDTASATARVLVRGSVNATEEDDALTAATAIFIRTTVSATEQDDTMAAVAAVAVRATLATAEQDDTLSAAALVRVTGSAGAVEDDDVLNAEVDVWIRAFLTAVEEEDFLTAAALVRTRGRRVFMINGNDLFSYISL